MDKIPTWIRDGLILILVAAVSVLANIPSRVAVLENQVVNLSAQISGVDHKIDEVLTRLDK